MPLKLCQEQSDCSLFELCLPDASGTSHYCHCNDDIFGLSSDCQRFTWKTYTYVVFTLATGILFLLLAGLLALSIVREMRCQHGWNAALEQNRFVFWNKQILLLASLLNFTYTIIFTKEALHANGDGSHRTHRTDVVAMLVVLALGGILCHAGIGFLGLKLVKIGRLAAPGGFKFYMLRVGLQAATAVTMALAAWIVSVFETRLEALLLESCFAVATYSLGILPGIYILSHISKRLQLVTPDAPAEVLTANSYYRLYYTFVANYVKLVVAAMVLSGIHYLAIAFHHYHIGYTFGACENMLVIGASLHIHETPTNASSSRGSINDDEALAKKRAQLLQIPNNGTSPNPDPRRLWTYLSRPLTTIRESKETTTTTTTMTSSLMKQSTKELLLPILNSTATATMALTGGALNDEEENRPDYHPPPPPTPEEQQTTTTAAAGGGDSSDDMRSTPSDLSVVVE